MSRALVRSSVTAWFAPPNVTGLYTIARSFPKRFTPGMFRSAAGGGQPGLFSGAVGVVFIVGDSEHREALGGQNSGKKRVEYVVELQMMQHSVHPHAEDAMDDFDLMVDAAKARLRADRQIGTAGLLFQAGENLLEGVYGEPKLLADGATEIWGSIRFDCSEYLNA